LAIGSTVGVAAGSAAGLSDPVTAAIAVGAGVGAVIGHTYSPLPAHNGGWGMPPARLQQWGFTAKPLYDDYEDVETREVISAAVPFGFSFRSREDGDPDE
jgi:hypothetical protein